MPFEVARTRLQWSTVAAGADPPEAAIPAHESLTVFERLGARLYVERTRRLLRELGVRVLPLKRRQAATGGLSARELDVARLVADDLTTPEIAARLVLSPRTVSAHLDRVYSRLGVNTRTALARYVVENGLLSP
ncbi:MAG: response regulator transcription factor [Dehalococcoidia bacterium]